MTAAILAQVFLIAVGLSADAFSVALADGLSYTDINRKRSFFIAIVFGTMQALMPLAGYWLVEGITAIAGEFAGAKAGTVTANIIVWVAFGLLIFIGGKMLFESIMEMRKPIEQKQPRRFTTKEVLVQGVATSIDALATGVALHAGLSNNGTVFLHVSIILVICFALSLVGLFLGKGIVKLLRGKTEIAGIIGGIILIGLAVWIVVSHSLGL